MAFLLRFLTEMDARRWRAVLVTLALFVVVGAVFLFGRTQLDTAEKGFEGWLSAFSGSRFGLLAAVAVFTAASFIGAPQFLLIAACVVVFGPWLGFLYSWIATVASAAVNYAAGRAAGGATLRRFGGGAVDRIAAAVGENAFWGSFIIRNVPSAPFIVVNMAFGVAQAPFWRFIAGCALGVLPKTALVAIFGRSFLSLSRDGDWRGAALLFGVGAAWLALMLLAREALRRRRPGLSSETS